MINASLKLSVSEQSHVGEARRRAASLAAEANFNETEAGKVAIVVTEMATNIIKHAQRGEIIFSHININGLHMLEFLAIDKGPGIADIMSSLEDGHSTAGSAGTGLGAIARQSSDFDIFSQADAGTVVMSRFFDRNTASAMAKENVSVGCVCVPVDGEIRCGDGWAVLQNGQHLKVLVVDGIGHGVLASEASQLAIASFHESQQLSPVQYVHAAHAALRATRGAALAVIDIDMVKSTSVFAGAGNIAASIIHGPSSRGLASYNGIVGHQLHKVNELNYPFPADALLVMASDGLNTRWNLAAYPALKMRHPSVIAGVLYRDFQRGRDDVTVLVAMLRSDGNRHKWI